MKLVDSISGFHGEGQFPVMMIGRSYQRWDVAKNFPSLISWLSASSGFTDYYLSYIPKGKIISFHQQEQRDFAKTRRKLQTNQGMKIVTELADALGYCPTPLEWTQVEVLFKERLDYWRITQRLDEIAKEWAEKHGKEENLPVQPV